MSKLRVASVQFALRKESSLEEFKEHVELWVSKAKNEAAEVVVFPELASTGLLATITDHEVTGKTVSRDYWDKLSSFAGEIEAFNADLAKRYQLTVLGGSHNRLADDGTLRNTAFLATADGRSIRQDKIHLTPPEHGMGMLGGSELATIELGDFTAGILICADIQFPELSRALVARGVDLILCPSLTWNRRGVHRVRIGCQARAIENQAFVVMSPLIGNSGLPVDAPLYAVGHALVSTPVDKTFGLNDGLLAYNESTDEGLSLADLDLELLLASREEPEAPGLKLQRPDLYGKLAEHDV